MSNFPTPPFKLRHGDDPIVRQWLEDNGVVWITRRKPTEFSDQFSLLFVSPNLILAHGRNNEKEFESDPYPEINPYEYINKGADPMGKLQITPELEQALAAQGYTLKKKEPEYPICKKGKEANVVMLFTGPTTGEVLWTGSKDSPLKGELKNLTRHDYQSAWQDWPYDHERKLFHGQPVWCWDDRDTHARGIRFYDAIEQIAFCYDGTCRGRCWEHIEPLSPEHYEDWMFEAFNTLDFSGVTE